ncbi:DNA methyltransferase [Cloacibacterium sp. TD35]|uniref:DNA methyltransferase n=1 Tax=Cloacibacterium sp. TD35 TaxID=2976818 RepID=UPI00237E8452|nr:DNA methyltransferase [Cloacibacterium sp. TD35]WDT67227.1 DNA methyltransferase [Cloacibacterium sp. TD35]
MINYANKKIHKSKIFPNPFIDKLYGKFSFQSYEDIKFYENIVENGIQTPLIIAKSGLIISGNRRYYCAVKSSVIKEIPVIIKDIEDENITEYMIVSLQLQRIKNEIQIAREYKIIGDYYKINRGKGNEIKNKLGREERDLLMKNSPYSETTIKRVLESYKLIKKIEDDLTDDDLWRKLENDIKTKSISAIHKKLKEIDGEILNNKLAKKIDISKFKNFRIFTRSCDDLSDIVEDNSIDCVCTSPPYYNGIRTYSEDKKNIKKGFVNEELEQLGHEKTPEEYVAKMVKYLLEFKRTLKNTGSIWVKVMDVRKEGKYFNVPEKLLIALENEGFITAQKCIWFKNNPPYDNNDVFQPSMEHIFHFVLDTKKYKWKDDWYDSADEFLGKITYGDKDKKRKFRNVFIYPTNKDERNERNGEGFVNSLIETNVINNSYLKKLLQSKGFHLQHNALYDLEIPMICILSTTESGDSVMDIFNGLGTTGLIAYANECDYIGIELSSVYSAQTIIRFEDFLEKTGLASMYNP